MILYVNLIIELKDNSMRSSYIGDRSRAKSNAFRGSSRRAVSDRSSCWYSIVFDRVEHHVYARHDLFV